MGDRVEVRDLRGAVRRLWWIPLLLMLMGAGAGVLAHRTDTPVYRAKGTVLVGQIDGTVLRSSSLRASESLAIFYADMARRQVVLEPVAASLGLGVPWGALRNDVSAVAMDNNPRLITISALSTSRAQAERVAEEVMKHLIALSPHPADGTEQQFVARQIEQLKLTIARTETLVERASRQLAQTSSPFRAAELRGQIAESQKLLNEWRRSYVDLTALDPDTDAGGLQVIDEVTTSRSSSSASMVAHGALGGSIGVVLGLVLSWLLSPRGSSAGIAPEVSPVEPEPSPPSRETVDKAVNGWPLPQREPVSSGERAPIPVRG